MSEETFDEEDDGFEIPWADPQIRKDYEAALGRLILAHNSLDRLLTELIQCCLNRLQNEKPLEGLRQGEFSRRLTSLTMLASLPIELDLRAIDTKEIGELNRLRNIVAHGHFEQDPFEGTYVLVTIKQTFRDFSTVRLDEITGRIEKQNRHLQAVTVFYDPPILI
jgi:Txe/YoeB family toxin of Txe-Axe toxin-antitoxin module